jgi:hypothetical protein
MDDVLIGDVVQYIDSTLTLMGRQPNSGAGPHTLTHSLTSPRSRNGGTTHDETGVEAEGRCRRVEIPPQSQRRDGECCGWSRDRCVRQEDDSP